MGLFIPRSLLPLWQARERVKLRDDHPYFEIYSELWPVTMNEDTNYSSWSPYFNLVRAHRDLDRAQVPRHNHSIGCLRDLSQYLRVYFDSGKIGSRGWWSVPFEPVKISLAVVWKIRLFILQFLLSVRVAREYVTWRDEFFIYAVLVSFFHYLSYSRGSEGFNQPDVSIARLL